MAVDADELGARAELEIGPLDLEASISLLGDEVRELRAGLERIGLRPRIARRLRDERMTSAAPATYIYFDLGGPRENGRAWDVRRYVVSLADPSATSTALVWPFIGTGRPPDSNTEPGTFPDLVDMAATLGSTGNASATWSRDELTLYWPEHLLFVVKSAPASTLITVTGQALEYELDNPEGGAGRRRHNQKHDA